MKVSIDRQHSFLLHIAFPFCILICMGLPAYAQGRYDNARDLVSRTQEDLRRVANITREKKDERERIDNTQRHLSQFDRALSRNKFDKDKLDAAIDDLKNVIDHNTLAVEDRDLLNRDLQDLRRMRSMRGR
jgi:septal ring factor EnvC (AmiA/AmiB activator)